MSRKKKKNVSEAAENKDDFLAQEAKEMEEQAPEYTLDIPEDEIWTYQIEGLQAPKINYSYDNAKKSKIAVVVILLIAISLSIFFSVRALKTTEYTFDEVESGGYELVSYVNPGSIREVTIDFVVGDNGKKDTTKPITELHDYAFNCDGAIERINIGKDVKRIDGKSIYSCWNLQYIDVDDENPYFCDIDGVLYNKDKTKIILYPVDYDRTRRLKEGYAHLEWECEVCGRKYEGKDGILRGVETSETPPAGFEYDKEHPEKFVCPGVDGKKCDSKGMSYYWACHPDLKDDDGNDMWELWGTTKKYDEKFFDEYNLKTRTYVIPSTVTEIGQLAFAYSNLTEIYMPEGIKTIGDQAIFKDEELRHFYSYKAETPVTGTFGDTVKELKGVYNSLPEGVETIGSDAFYHLRRLDYIYFPSSVKKIGHHCMWEAVYQDEESKELSGLTEVYVALDEESLKENCDLGENWVPEYNNGLFNKKVPVNYSAQRK
ncbi:MAG: leucine-rich repeat domain-containing protein [Eubacterium sp.]|nr:leucine-rich repeat domain-containing protein [Eubacterium sp.]